jgi:hypothetical protein
VLADVIPADYVRHSGVQVALRLCAEVPQSKKAPRARQAQSVEMALLRIGMVYDVRRLREPAETARQELLHPFREVGCRQYGFHQDRFHQRG